MRDRIEAMIELAWTWKAIYPSFQLLLWDTKVGFWFSGEEDYGL